MKRNPPNTDDVLKEAWSSASLLQIDEAKQRVLGNLRSQPNTVDEHRSDSHSPRFRFVKLKLASAGIAALVALLVWFALPAPVAVAETSLYRMRGDIEEQLKRGDPIAVGDIVRADPNHSGVVAMSGGSRLELKSKSELLLESVRDGVNIRLHSGAVIVNAAGQSSPHLYIETRDLRVPAAGNVFLVNAEIEGSRVGSINGELRVQNGSVAKTLAPGEQVSTSPHMEWQLLSEEIQWSPNAEKHIALLQQSTAPAPAAQRLEFSVISVKPYHRSPGPPSSTEAFGFGCRGSDGLKRDSRGGAEMMFPLGRCIGNDVTVPLLMNYAFGVPWRYGANIPEWARHEGTLSGAQGLEAFQIEALADDPTTTTTEQLRQMVRAMLVDRFNLKIHREQQEIQSYSLVIAKSGLKIKEASGEPEQPCCVGLIKGKSSMEDLARFLTNFFIAFQNLGYLDFPVIDKTGLKGIYEYEFRQRPPTGTGPRGQSSDAGPARTDRVTNMASNISIILEEELGLRLQPEKTTTEVIVMDQIERPAAN
jgi:uncharacterized protein (TIGR03435 family)